MKLQQVVVYSSHQGKNTSRIQTSCFRPEQPEVTALSWRSGSSTEGKLRYYIFIWLQIVDPAYSSVVWNVKCTFFGPTLWPGLFFCTVFRHMQCHKFLLFIPLFTCDPFLYTQIVVTIFLWNPWLRLWPNSNVVTEHYVQSIVVAYLCLLVQWKWFSKDYQQLYKMW